MPKLARGAEGPKLRALNMKTTQTVRERLEAAAVASGRSLSSEVEHRLIDSLAASDLRTLIREEIRAALAERREPHYPHERAMSGLREAQVALEDACFGPRPDVLQYRY